MLNELKAVEKLIKDRLTEKSAELNKATWEEKENENNIFKRNSHESVIFQIKRLGDTLSIIRDEIRNYENRNLPPQIHS